MAEHPISYERMIQAQPEKEFDCFGWHYTPEIVPCSGKCAVRKECEMTVRKRLKKAAKIGERQAKKWREGRAGLLAMLDMESPK